MLVYFLFFYICEEKQRIKSHNPTHIALNNNVVYFCDESGNNLWDFKFSPEQGFRSSYLPPPSVKIKKLVDFADIDRDSRNEVVFFRLSDDLENREILVFDNDGSILFKKKFVPNQRYAEMSLDNNAWRVDYLMMADIQGDEIPEILAIWKNQSRFPSSLVIYDRYGNELYRYNHTGHLHRIEVFKNREGKKFIYLAGTNNLLDGNAVLSVLNCDHLVSGTAPPYSVPEDLEHLKGRLGKYTPLQPKKGVQEYYLRITHNELSRLVTPEQKSKYLRPRITDISDEGITFTIKVMANRFLFYTLNSSFRLKSIIPSRSFQDDWNNFFNQKKISLSLESFVKNSEKDILFWTDSGWAPSY